MSSNQKRGRACIACASIKIKCQLGSDTGLQPPCERCVRLNKECVLSTPKRQKDRVAELEAQVAALTRLLQEQGIQDPGVATTQSSEGSEGPSPWQPSTAVETNGHARKRRLLDDSESPSSVELISGSSLSLQDAGNADLDRLDTIVPRDLQQRILDHYLTEVVPAFPMVPIPGDVSLDAIRAERPVLLQSIIYAASPGLISLDMQEEVARTLLNRLSSTTLDQGDKSLEFIQAIQITCLWYRAPKHHKHIAAYQLIALASQLADDIGICGPLTTPSFAYSPKGENVEATDALRAWLGCHHLSSVMGNLMRSAGLPSAYSEEPSHPFGPKMARDGTANPNSSKFKTQHDDCLLFMEYSPVSLPTDRFIGQYFRAEKLCSDIVDQMELCDLVSYHDVSEPGMKTKIQTCKNQILNWKVKIPQALRGPTLLLWEHVATAYMYEVVLHTPTNKRSFSAPYVAESLSCSDFPSPLVTQDHITAVYELLAALHAIIDIITGCDAATMIALPGLLYASRAAYANYLLAKLYIATTAPGNTLGSILDPSILRAEEYGEKLVDLGVRVKAVDERCAPARMLIAASRMQEWYTLYNSSVLSGSNFATAPNDFQLGTDTMGTGLPGQPTNDWIFQFSDSAADFGLDILFAEPLPFDPSFNPLAYPMSK